MKDLQRKIVRLEERIIMKAISRTRREHQMKKDTLADPVEFFKYLKTKDEHDPESPVKPFPIEKDYLRLLIHRLATMPILLIPKSRQMLVTWTVCGYLLWSAKRNPYQLIFAQSKKE